MLRFDETSIDKLRITILSSRKNANICKVAAYYAEPIPEENK